jgi:hypothetical protein
MSMHAPTPAPRPATPGGRFLAFLILSAISVALLLAGFVLAIEPRMSFTRSTDGTCRATGSNFFAGHQISTRTIEGVKTIVVDDAVRDDRRDSPRVNRRRKQQKHLEISGANNAALEWDRESDMRVIEDFLRGSGPALALQDAPSMWRMPAAWGLIALGVLGFLGAIQSSFFPKKRTIG